MPDTQTLELPASASTALRVDRDTLLAAVAAVGQVVEKRNTIPILSNVLLRVDGDMLTVLATDLDLWSQRRIACNAMGRLETTVDALKLKDAINSLRPGAIDITQDAAALTIRQGRSTRTLVTLPADDFPLLKKIEQETTFAIDASRLLEIVDAARVSASTEEARYYLNGVFFHHKAGKLNAVSSNGHTLARVSVDCPAGAENIPDSIVGNKAVGLICSLLGDLDDGAQVEFALAPTRFQLISNKVILGGKLIDGTFPQYERLIPEKVANSLLVPSAEFDRCIRAAGTASEGKTRGIRIDLSPKGCETSARGHAGDRSVEPIEGEYRGVEQATGVNLLYAQAVARMFGTAAKIEIGFNGPTDPFLITSEDRKGLTMVVMPMRA